MVSLSARATTQSALLALAVTTLSATGAEARSAPGGFIQPGQATAAPRGFVEMCESGVEPGFCSPTRPVVASATMVTAGLSERTAEPLPGGNPIAAIVKRDALVSSTPSTAALSTASHPSGCMSTPWDRRLDLAPHLVIPAGDIEPTPRLDCSTATTTPIGVPSPWQGFDPPALIPAIAWRRDESFDLAPAAGRSPPTLAHASLWGSPGPCAPSAIASMLASVSTQLCAFTLPEPPPPARAAAEVPTTLSDAALKTLLKKVNRHVNGRVRQRSDAEIYGVGELWRRSGVGDGAVGDCEDVAIEKRAELVAAGFPSDRLAFAVVYSRASGLHTVLIARTEKEDVVLDGRSPYVTGWSQVDYSWISVQSMNDPMLWYAPRRQDTV
ncbi:transglutaminase-like cysteine peptidase [Sphingomonas sp.]|uniref:transglutaminase-like cysteine peptidase n=1 Tax=Sphingomonas sp. TaxID=28214 RepID=UPI0031CFD32D